MALDHASAVGSRYGNKLTVVERDLTWSHSVSGQWAESMNRSFDASVETVSLKILLVGSSGVGKTSLLLRFCDSKYANTFISTVGVDFRTKTLWRGGRRVKLQVWDTAGQERYRAIAKQCFRGAAGFLICYDITRRETFDNVRRWCADVQEGSCDIAQIMLIGTKLDLSSNRAVSTHEGASFASELGWPFLETSAKEGEGVQAAFDSLTDRILAVLDKSDGNAVQIFRPDTMSANGVDLEAGCMC